METTFDYSTDGLWEYEHTVHFEAYPEGDSFVIDITSVYNNKKQYILVIEGALMSAALHAAHSYCEENYDVEGYYKELAEVRKAGRYD